MPLLRTMMNTQREFNPQAFNVFGPKIVATRGRYEDSGLESRFITEETGSKPLRADIPLHLPPSFKKEARELRNKLLLYRFHRLHAVQIDASLTDASLEPRFNQIMLPLLSVVSDPQLRENVREMALRSQQSLATERSLFIEAQVLEVLAELMHSSKRPVVPVADVTLGLIRRYGREYDRPITNRWIGGILRRKLNLQTYKSHGIYVVPISEREKLELLCKRYGVSVISDVTPHPAGEMGTSGT